jgi:hypothetical protein
VPRGRPAVKPTISLTLWMMVELMRDRKQRVRARASVRKAADRVAKHLAEHFRGGVVPTAETVRRHYKQFERVMRRGGDEAELAIGLLANARQRRDLLGWDTPTWLLMFDPAAALAVLTALGFEPSTPE